MLKTSLIGWTLLASSMVHAAPAAKEIKYTPKVSSIAKLPTAKKGGTLYMSLSNNPKVINPLISSDKNSVDLEQYIWATLMSEDPDTLDPIPYLATSYTISADRKNYTFKLNDKAKWDDGTPFTSEDIVFTFQKLQDPKVDAAPLRSYFDGVTVEAIDPLTVKFTVAQPKFDSLRQLYLFAPVQKKQFVNEPDFNKSKAILNPVGTGPYKFSSFSRDQKVELVRNKEWWGASLPQLKNRFNFDQIVFRIITDVNLNYEKWLKGDVDVGNFTGWGSEVFANRIRGNDADKVGRKPTDGKPVWADEFQNKAPRGFSYIGWNLRNPMFQSVKTRTALSHLVDYQQIIDKVFYGFQYQSTSPFGSATLNSDQSLRKPPRLITFNRQKALQMLKEDGWAPAPGKNILTKTINGKPVEFSFILKTNSNNPLRVKIAQILKENFKAAGINVDIRSMEWNAFIEDVDKRNFDAVVLAWTATPFPNPRQIWHTDSQKNEGSNAVGYSNPKVDALIDKANLEMDIHKRAKILQEIDRLIYEDQPYTFLLEPRSMLAGFNKKLKSSVWAMTYDVDPPVDIYSAQ